MSPGFTCGFGRQPRQQVSPVHASTAVTRLKLP